jgi:hypothetical protein
MHAWQSTLKVMTRVELNAATAVALAASSTSAAATRRAMSLATRGNEVYKEWSIYTSYPSDAMQLAFLGAVVVVALALVSVATTAATGRVTEHGLLRCVGRTGDTWCRVGPLIGPRGAGIRRFFATHLDRDGDGVLSLAEVHAYVTIPGEPLSDLARAHVQASLDVVDADGDGVLSWREFAAAFGKLDVAARYEGASAVAVVPEQVRLYLGRDPSETTVVWTTFNTTAANLVQYGVAPGAYTAAISGTQYTYNVGPDGPWPS